MGRIERLADTYSQHIRLPWPQTAAGAERVVMLVYPKELECLLQVRKDLFAIATKDAGHEWFEVDVANSFAEWMAQEDLNAKLESDFTVFVTQRIRSVLKMPEVGKTAAIAVLGIGTLFGFAHVSQILKMLEPDIHGRLVVFFPGTCAQNNYQLLDARDGWNYLAVPITL
jgi:hypothetical protein